jgi:hypothetical protein
MSNNIDIEKLKSYINDLEETIIPLQKSKSKGKTDTAEPEEKPKITRTLTDRKKEQLQKAREVRQSNVEIRKKTKKLEHAKLLLENEISKPAPPAPIPKPTKPKPQSESEQSDVETSSDESSEPEIVIVKKSKKKKEQKPVKIVKKKKPPKKIVIEESSTESESEESDTESSPEPIQKKPQVPGREKDFGKSHKNKRSSVIKVHDHPGPRNSSQPVNYFCD